MNYHRHVLPNKLRLITVPMPSSESSTMVVWVRTGSRFEDPRTLGLSHFLEHMVFKGSKKRPSAKEISEVVDGFGGEFNAGTSKEWTNFHIKARNEKMGLAADVLSDMVLNPLIKSAEVEREKGTICEEIAMYEDTPIRKIGDLFENVIYKGSPLGWDIAGTKETVRSVKRSDFIKYRDLHYYPENMLITVAGGISDKDAEAIVKKSFSSLKKSGRLPMVPSDPLTQSKPETLLKYKETDQTHMIVGFKGAQYGAKTRYAESVLSVILGGGMSSRLFLEVRERRGLAYSVRTMGDHNFDAGYLGAYGGIRTDKADEAIKVILGEFYDLAAGKKKITRAELLKAKEFLKGHLALSLEDSEGVCEFFGLEELYLGEGRTPKEVYEEVDKVSMDEIYKVAKDFFRPERLNLALIGPFKDVTRFEKLLK
jgi:predicted Zn-dependent peptidase